MVRLFRFLWKLFIVASVFGIGYIIGREHSFEEDEDWDSDDDSSTDIKSDDSSSATQAGAGATAATAAAAAVSGSEKLVAFEYKDEKATSCSVVGDFNDWNKDKTPLKLENGSWRCNISLKPGRHEYKFVVNNTDWITDPKGSETAPDKYGGRSSIITVA